MEYILDITSPKIQKAMRALSITNEELRIKTPNSFLSPGIPEHIQQLRYSHYTAKSTSLANRVLNYLKKPVQSSSNKTSALCHYKSSFRDNQNEVFKKNYQKALLSFYEFEKKTRKSEAQVLQKNDRDETIGNRLKEFVKGRRDKLEVKFMRNKENLRMIEMERERKTEETIDRINRRGKSNSVCHSREKSVKIRPASIVNDDIDYKLQKINKRMIRSSENYQKLLKEKIQKVRIPKQKVKSKSDNYEELVIGLVAKHKNAESRREKFKQETLAKAHNKEFKFIDQMKFKQSQELDSKLQELKNKDKKTEDFLLRIKLRQRHEIEYKHEKHKLQKQCVKENTIRDKRIMNMKKEKIIEKHLELSERQKEQMKYLERANRKTREKAMNFTLKKEKMHDIRSRISKSQTPERINKFLNTI